MEEQTTEAKQQGGIGKYVLPAAIIVIIAIAAIYLYVNNTNSTTVEQTHVTNTTKTQNTSTASAYKDGTYEATGNYVSPGGPRDIGLKVTIKGGVITDSVFEGRATDPTSKRFQEEFADGYKSQVIGKNINDINLTKVSGSSLTPKGFDDALEKIKTEAKA